MKLLLKDTNKDDIIAYLKDPEVDCNLTGKQKQLMNYYVDAYTLIRNYSSLPDAVNVLVKLSIARGEPISASTARRYIHDAQDVFGYVSVVKPIAVAHYCDEVFKDAIAMARDQNDPKTMILGAKELRASSGTEKEQPFNAEMLEQHIIEINLDPGVKDLLTLLTGKGTLDLDALMGNVMNQVAEDVEIITPDETTG